MNDDIIWHPYTQMKTAPAPVAIERAEGVYLYDERGKKYIDAISSWWVNLHGHSHPHIAGKIGEQARTMEHVMLAGFTHRPARELAARLLKHIPGEQGRVFYSDDGSTAVEVAIKMALQYWFNQGQPKTRLIAFKEAYHGDTFGAMSVSGRSAFTTPFESLLFAVDFIEAPVPGREEKSVQELREVIRQHRDELAAFIFEPLVQGTAGMVMHTPEALEMLIRTCQDAGIFCIADEVMTGFGRTGKWFACEYLHTYPDIYCFSKGITGGAMPMGVTTCTERVYEAFLSEDRLKTLFHGHSYTGNPLACAAGLGSMDLMEEPGTWENIGRIGRQHRQFAGELEAHPRVKEVRCRGTILALEWDTGGETSYFSELRDRLYGFFMENGVLLRPLGNIVYILPPYCIREAELEFVYEKIRQALNEI